MSLRPYRCSSQLQRTVSRTDESCLVSFLFRLFCFLCHSPILICSKSTLCFLLSLPLTKKNLKRFDEVLKFPEFANRQ